MDNPVLQGILLELRDRSTPRPRFRQLLEAAGMLLGYEAARSLPVRKRSVITPLGEKAEGIEPRDDEVVVVAVLRAALPMAMGVLRVLEDAEIGFVAASRLEETRRETREGVVFEVEAPYWKLPPVRDRSVVLVDPMLATGSTLSRIATRVASESPRDIIVVSLIATRPGIKRVEEGLGGMDFDLYTAAVDPRLNERGFIVPGLGDAGDRAFGET